MSPPAWISGGLINEKWQFRMLPQPPDKIRTDRGDDSREPQRIGQTVVWVTLQKLADLYVINPEPAGRQRRIPFGAQHKSHRKRVKEHIMSTSNESAGFFTGGAPAVKFEKIGDTVSGVIVDLEKRQQTDFKTRELLFWPDGKPRWQLGTTLQTNSDDADDDGLRRVYVKGQMVGAIAKALREAGVRVDDGLEVGATLTVVYTGDGEAKNGLNPPKQFTAKYEPRPDLPPDLD